METFLFVCFYRSHDHVSSCFRPRHFLFAIKLSSVVDGVKGKQMQKNISGVTRPDTFAAFFDVTCSS